MKQNEVISYKSCENLVSSRGFQNIFLIENMIKTVGKYAGPILMVIGVVLALKEMVSYSSGQEFSNPIVCLGGVLMLCGYLIFRFSVKKSPNKYY